MQHCSATDGLIGAAPVWASIIILLVIGFVVGCITGFLAAMSRQKKMTRHIAPEIHNDEEQVRLALSSLLALHLDSEWHTAKSVPMQQKETRFAEKCELLCICCRDPHRKGHYSVAVGIHETGRPSR